MPAPLRSLSSTRTLRTQNMEDDPSRTIKIKVFQSPGGIYDTYEVPVDMQLHKLLKQYCECRQLEYNGMNFIYKGRRVKVRKTVDELHMVEGDEIYAFVRRLQGVGDGSTRITIDIAGPDGIIVTFSIPVDLPLHKLLKRYCEHRQLEYQAMLFLDHSGERIQVRRTASELHMVEGDQITAFVA